MSLGVECEVVGARKRARTVYTLERLGSGVLANVPRQLVRTRKVPLTTGEVTTIWLLTCHTRATSCQTHSNLI